MDETVLERVRAGVEALQTHEAHADEPGVVWLCVPNENGIGSRECWDYDAHYRLVDRASVLAILEAVGVLDEAVKR